MSSRRRTSSSIPSGAAGGSGHAIEYAGSTIRRHGLEDRMTIRNLSIELGAKIGMIAPDATTFEYLAGRRFAPQGAAWDQAVAHWRTLVTDDDATFDREVSMTPTPSRRKSPGAPTPSTSSRSMM